MIEVGLLNSRREPDQGETRIQQRFPDVGSKAAVGSGDPSDFFEPVLGCPKGVSDANSSDRNHSLDESGP
jgi:hypothetical protein